MKQVKTILFMWVLLASLGNSAFAQQILFDKGIKAGALTVFPELSNPGNYYYLSDKIQVSKHADGSPEFSFMRYVRNTLPGATTNAITETNQAGGVLHVLVNLAVPEEMIREARQELLRINGSAKLMGPIIFKSGKVAVISSVIGDNGELTRKVVGLGSAPILEGQKAAVSVLLTKEGADILWATFQTATPDLSFQFEMDVRGYLSPKNVKIEANFDQIYKHRSIEMAAVSPVFAAEIKDAFDDLSNSGAIKVTQVGEDEGLNKMKETAYNQLVNLIFDKVGGQGVQDFSSLLPQNNKSMLERATEMLSKARTEAQTENQRLERLESERRDRERFSRDRARRSMDSVYRARNLVYPEFSSSATPQNERQIERVPVPEFAVAASFVMKTIKRSGRYFIDLNKYTEDLRTFPFSENVGNMLKLCPGCFLSVNLDDPLYKQREVMVQLNGINIQDFTNYISNVEVMIRKTHQNNETTLENLVIDKNSFNASGNNFRMQYGWKGDNDRTKWLNFDYRTKWVFGNGYAVESDWSSQEFSSINMIPPLVQKDLYIELDPDLVTRENIRAAEVKIYFKNESWEEVRIVNLTAASNVLSKSVVLILPRNKDNYEYEVTWFIKGKAPVKSARKPYNYGTLYLDTITN
jgi:hypothetical protein